MGWAHRDREAHGKALKKAAKQCGVPRETWLLLKPNSARAAYAAVAQLCAATPAGTPGKEPAAAAWLALQRAFLAPIHSNMHYHCCLTLDSVIAETRQN